MWCHSSRGWLLMARLKASELDIWNYVSRDWHMNKHFPDISHSLPWQSETTSFKRMKRVLHNLHLKATFSSFANDILKTLKSFVEFFAKFVYWYNERKILQGSLLFLSFILFDWKCGKEDCEETKQKTKESDKVLMKLLNMKNDWASKWKTFSYSN